MLQVASSLRRLELGGPNNKDLADAPGCISTVVAVGEVNNLDVRAPTSSYGDFMLDHGLMAPGTDIFSTWLNDGYHTLSGTSMATPMVSGTVALLLSKNPNLTPLAIRKLLFDSADCVLSPCPNIQVGHGRVNAMTAITALDASLYGNVFDAVSHSAIAGALVEIRNQYRSYSGTTSSTGAYQINVLGDTYTVTSSRCNYDAVSTTVTVFFSTFEEFQLILSGTGALSGYVTDTEGRYLQGATVASCGLSTTTNALGYYSLSVYGGHLVSVAASKSGYNPGTGWVNVTVGGSATKDLVLTCIRICNTVAPPIETFEVLLSSEAVRSVKRVEDARFHERELGRA